MAAGVEAVVAQLKQGFGSIQITEEFDIDTKGTLLGFEAEGLDYRVRVTHEYNEDYASGQIRVDLKDLVTILRASNSGRVRIMRDGIIAY